MFWRIKEWKTQGGIEDLSTGDETTVEEGLGEDDWVDKGRRGERVEVGNVVEKHFSIRQLRWIGKMRNLNFKGVLKKLGFWKKKISFFKKH